MTNVVTKFLPRLIDCVIDIDVHVQEMAMEFMLLLIRSYYDFFHSIEHDDTIWNQLNVRAIDPYTTSNTVRKLALYIVLEQLDFDTTIPTGASSERDIVTQLHSLGKWYVF
jgi:hypothetical protein